MLRRRANRLAAKRLLNLQGKRKRSYGEPRWVLFKEWKQAAIGAGLDEDAETLPDEWLRTLNFHLDEFGVVLDVYQGAIAVQYGFDCQGGGHAR